MESQSGATAAPTLIERNGCVSALLAQARLLLQIRRGRDGDFSPPPAHLWAGRALQEESSDGHAVRINLSGLWLELALRAIMEIRAHLSSLDPRPRGPCAGPDFSCAGETVFPSSSFPLANLGGTSITFCLAATTVMRLLVRTWHRIRVHDRAPPRRCERACWPTPQQRRFCAISWMPRSASGRNSFSPSHRTAEE